MRRLVPSVLFALFLAVSFPAAAAMDCYFLAGYGSGIYSRSLTDKFEDKVFDSRYIQKNSTYKNNSHPYQIGGGCQPWRYLAFEVDYFQGLHTDVTTHLMACAEISKYSFCTKPGIMRRRMSLEGWEASAVGLIPLSERWFVTVRLGAFSGTARAKVSFPQLSEEIDLSTEKHGTIPIAGVGIKYQANRDFSLGLEQKQFDGNSKIKQLVMRWRF